MKELKSHPHFPLVQQIYLRLAEKGFEVYLAGGCVRDGVLGIKPNDFDLATSATPDEVIALFEKTVPLGKAFGTVIVVNQGVDFEVTTFRSDGLYEDGRHPTVVQFSSAEEDAKRRDFTMNALFYDLSKNQVVDFVGGLKDIENRLIRAVGNPTKRFLEDHLRILRALRFVGQLDFKIEEFTREAIKAQVQSITTVSAERIHQELEKLLSSKHWESALKKFESLGFRQALFPGQPLQVSPWKNFWPLEKNPDSQVLVWFLFFNCVWNSKFAQELDSQFKKLRFSSRDSKSLHKMLEWRKETDVFREKPLGELVEKCFDSDHWTAFQIYAAAGILDPKKFEQVKTQFLKFNFVKPEPIIRAIDLPEIKGAALGESLKKVFWAQLEGLISTKDQAQKFLKSN